MTRQQLNTSDLDERMAPLIGSKTPMLWHEPDRFPFRLAGFPWYGQERVFRRLPVTPPRRLPDAVDQLANCTAGGQVSFQSDSSHIAIRVALAGPADMNHMPATGQCGFDLYVGEPLRQRFHSVAKYDHHQTSYEVLLFEHPDKEMRSFILNFPLYQGVRRVHIGLTPKAQISPPLPWSAKSRVVVYGTSITQGGCASRPGMAYTNILSRALNAEVINLGFSGNGRGEPDVVRVIADVPDPRLFAFDYEANSCCEGLRETLPEALHIVRDKHNDVPILIVSRIPFAMDLTHLGSRKESEQCRDMQAKLVEAVRKNGDLLTQFVDGSTLLGPDFDECTVDGVHPNDLGFMRIARGLEPEIRRILDIKRQDSQPGAEGDGLTAAS